MPVLHSLTLIYINASAFRASLIGRVAGHCLPSVALLRPSEKSVKLAVFLLSMNYAARSIAFARATLGAQ